MGLANKNRAGAPAGNPCPTLGKANWENWAILAQSLGKHCPIIGQTLPNHWATLPNHWATVAQALGKLGNPCPIIGKTLPNHWENIAQSLGNLAQPCPTIGQPLLGKHCPRTNANHEGQEAWAQLWAQENGDLVSSFLQLQAFWVSKRTQITRDRKFGRSRGRRKMVIWQPASFNLEPSG